MEITQAIRLLISCACGLAIGFERQRHIRQQHRKSAGMRTHMLVCIASAAMMLVSKYGFMDVLFYGDNVRVDVSRVASGIVSGIGFLGAGIIYVRRESIQGLTTAAGIWAAAAVGMSIGSGMYFVGILLTFMIVIIQELARMRIYQNEEKLKTIVIYMSQSENALRKTIDWLRQNNIDIRNTIIEREEHNIQLLTVHVVYQSPEQKDCLVNMSDELPFIKSIEY